MNSTSASQSTSANSSSRLLLPKPGGAGVQESIADIALSQLDAKLLKGQSTATC